jgi:WD40 repeat protein
MSPPALPPSPPGFERSLAVVVGVNAYSHGVPALHNAVRDATAVADALEHQGFEVIRLLDSQASLQALRELLSNHLPCLQPSLDRLVIYFAGHGLAHTDDQHQLSGFLLPADARRDVPSSYWPMAALRESLRQLPCRHLLLILDCCFAGAFPHAAVRDLRPAPTSTPLYLERFRHFTAHRSFQLLLSTAHDELASDRLLAKPSQETLGDGQHSPFALALLQGLAPRSPADFNQDGLLTASELYTFLRDRLVSLLPSHHQQTPSLWNLDWHDGGEFLFSLGSALPELPSAAPLSKDFNPYLGLRPFSATHRHLFFGRERGIAALCEHLLTQPLLLLCGPSGAGKSSLVHAGLLPRLSESGSWRIPDSLRPSARPLHALASWLSSVAPGAVSPSAADLSARPEAARDFLSAVLSQRPALCLLLVIDPLEELVTACLDKHRRAAFLRALSSLLQLEHPRLRAVLLLRSDFEPHFLSLLTGTAFPLALWHTNRITVPLMNRDELRRCIEKPAEVRTLFFAPGLVERLLDDVEQMPGALPLLSVALSELFDAHLESGREDRTLSFADYERLGGGIAGALQRRAELVFSGAPPPLPESQSALPSLSASQRPAFQRTLRNVLLRMASPEGGELTRRRVRRAELEYSGAEDNALVQRALLTLEASRLIVASDDGGPCVEPAHDALLTAWPRLHDWVRQAQRELLLLRRISHAASEWARHGGATDFLWTDTRLEQLGLPASSLHHEDVPLTLSTSSPGSQPAEPLAFNAQESAFLRASAARRRSLRRRRYSIQFVATTSILLLAVVSLFYAGIAKQETLRAAQNGQQALQEKSAAVQAQARAEANEKKALASAQEALRQKQAADDSAQEALRQKQAADDSAQEALRQKQAADDSAHRASQQEELAKAKALEASHQREIAEEQAREASRQREVARANAQRAQEQEQAALENAQEAQHQQEAADASAHRARQQEQLALGNAQEAQHQQERAEHSASEAIVQQNLASLSAQEARTQRDAADTNARRAQSEAEQALFSSKLAQTENLLNDDPTKAALVLQEALITTPSSDNPWLQTALALQQQEVSEAILEGLEYPITLPPQFSPDGSHVLAFSGNTLYLWRADGAGQPLVLTGADSPPYSAAFSPDSSRVLALASNTALLWRTDRAEPPRLLLKTQTAADLGHGTFSPDGSRLLITARNVLRIWRMDESAPPLELVGTKAPLDSAAFSPDGSLILTNASDGTTQLWNADGTGRPLTLATASQPAYSAQFSPDGARIVARSGTSILLWSTRGAGVPRIVPTPAAFLDSVAFNPQADRILATSAQGELILWRISETEVPGLLSPPSRPMRFAHFSPDGLHVVALEKNTALLWDLRRAGPDTLLAGSCDYMKSAQFNPKAASLSTLCLNGTAALWKTDVQEEPQLLSTETAPVDSITFSPDGLYAVTNSGSSAQIWRADVRVAPRALKGHTQDVQHVVFSADGSRLLTTAGTSVRVWRPRPQGSIPFPMSVTAGVAGAVISPDDSLMVTTSFDHTVHLWSMKEERPPRVLIDSTALVLLAGFNSDGSQVLTSSYTGPPRAWPVRGASGPVPLSTSEGPAYASLADGTQPHPAWGSRFLTVWPAVAVSIESVDAKTPTIMLAHSGVTQAFFFEEGRRIATLSAHELRTWPLEPSLMRDSLQHMTTACLSRTERIGLLRETPAQADAGFSRCQRSHERAPGERQKPAASNSIDDSAFFVNQIYLDLLERPPNAVEKRQGLSALQYCSGTKACLSRARTDATWSLFVSPEHRSFQNLYEDSAGYLDRFITRSYTGFARRRPEGGGELLWRTSVAMTGDFTIMIRTWLVAPEYRARFGLP